MRDFFLQAWLVLKQIVYARLGVRLDTVQTSLNFLALSLLKFDADGVPGLLFGAAFVLVQAVGQAHKVFFPLSEKRVEDVVMMPQLSL